MTRSIRAASAWILCAAGCFHAGCGGDDGISPPPPRPECTGPISIQVNSDSIPLISWTPDCKIGRLLIEHGFDEFWGTETCGENTYASPIRYGVNPPNTCPEEPAIQLVPGLTYSVRAFRFFAVAPVESLQLLGEQFFTYPIPDSIGTKRR